MKALYNKEKIMQTSLRWILSAIFLIFSLIILPSQAGVVWSEKDVYDVKTNAMALYNTSQGQRALALLETIPSQYRNEEIYTIMGNIYEDAGDTNKALDMLNKALAVNPEYFKAYYNFGTVYIKRQSWDLAIKNFKLSIKYNKEFPYAYYNLGYCYLQKREYGNAKKNFIKAISLKGDDKDFYQSLAYTYKMLGQEKNAKKVLDAYNKL